MTHYLIIGGSRGLGAALAEGVPTAGDTVWLLSRGRPPNLEDKDDVKRHWLSLDLRNPTTPEAIVAALDGAPLDVIVYNAGIWEKTAFSSRYDFDQISPKENDEVLTVNLTAPLHILQRLLPHVRRSANGKIILIGSTSALDNTRAPEVAYNVSKFGLRGLAHSLREHLRPDHVGVTLINPGSINTQTPLAAGIDGAAAYATDMIPVGDLVALVQTVVSLSRYSCVKEINVPAMLDPHA